MVERNSVEEILDQSWRRAVCRLIYSLGSTHKERHYSVKVSERSSVLAKVYIAKYKMN